MTTLARLLAAVPLVLALAMSVAACGTGDDAADRGPARPAERAEPATTGGAAETTDAETGAEAAADADAPGDPASESDPAMPRNVRLTAADRADLLDVANAWKRTHESSWGGPDGKFEGVLLEAPRPGDVYHSGWLDHDYAYATFPLEGWPAENSMLFVRDADLPDDDPQWRVLRHDTATDIGGICSLPTPLVGLWFRELGDENGCSPLAAPAGEIDASTLVKSPRLLQSTDRNVICLLELSERRVQVACARARRPVGAALGEGEPAPTSSRRNHAQLDEELFDSTGATSPRATTLGLDDDVRVTRGGTEVLRCSSPAGTGITCTTPGGGTLDLGPTNDPV